MWLLLCAFGYGCIRISFSALLFGSGPAVAGCCPLPSVLAAARAGWLPGVAAVAQGGRCVALAADSVGGWMPGPVPACAAACAPGLSARLLGFCLCRRLWLLRSGPAAVAPAALLFQKKIIRAQFFMSCTVHYTTISNKNICQMWYIFMLKKVFPRSASLII